MFQNKKALRNIQVPSEFFFFNNTSNRKIQIHASVIFSSDAINTPNNNKNSRNEVRLNIFRTKMHLPRGRWDAMSCKHLHELIHRVRNGRPTLVPIRRVKRDDVHVTHALQGPQQPPELGCHLFFYFYKTTTSRHAPQKHRQKEGRASEPSRPVLSCPVSKDKRVMRTVARTTQPKLV